MTTSIKRLHHAAYRCKNSAETRTFYEDFLELLVEAFPIQTTKTGRQADVLHTFYQMADGSCQRRYARNQRSRFRPLNLLP